MKKKLLQLALALVFAVTLHAAAAPAPAAKGLPMGPGKIECPTGKETITVFTYKPPTYKDGPLFVIFHGVQRNAEDYRNFAIVMAERFHAIVVAPLLDKEQFPLERYQRGGIVDKNGVAQPKDSWTYAFVPKIVAAIRTLEGKPQMPYYLIGHSAGGQFLERMAAFLPGDAVRIVACNPGSELFPTKDQDFGYGFGKLPDELSNEAAVRAYLAAPLTLFLGTGDITPEHSLDVSEAANRQGKYRLYRGRNVFEFAQKLARDHGWAFNWRKVETPGIDHDAARMFASKEMEDAIFGKN